MFKEPDVLEAHWLIVGMHLDVQEILEIEQLMDEDTGLELTEDNIETVLDEIRPYLVGELILPRVCNIWRTFFSVNLNCAACKVGMHL